MRSPQVDRRIAASDGTCIDFAVLDGVECLAYDGGNYAWISKREGQGASEAVEGAVWKRLGREWEPILETDGEFADVTAFSLKRGDGREALVLKLLLHGSGRIGVLTIIDEGVVALMTTCFHLPSHAMEQRFDIGTQSMLLTMENVALQAS